MGCRTIIGNDKDGAFVPDFLVNPIPFAAPSFIGVAFNCNIAQLSLAGYHSHMCNPFFQLKINSEHLSFFGHKLSKFWIVDFVNNFILKPIRSPSTARVVYTVLVMAPNKKSGTPSKAFFKPNGA